MSKEIDGREVVELTEMGINLMKLDIMLDEIEVARVEVRDYEQVYKILEEERGNPMLNGSLWRGRVMETMKKVFMTIIQAGNITDVYENHVKVVNYFIKSNSWKEKCEFVSVGWVENYEKSIKISARLVKRTSDFIAQRLEIFKTKMAIIDKCKEKQNLGKRYLLGVKRLAKGWNV